MFNRPLEKARIHLQMNLNINYFKEKELSRIMFLKKKKGVGMVDSESFFDLSLPLEILKDFT